MGTALGMLGGMGTLVTLPQLTLTGAALVPCWDTEFPCSLHPPWTKGVFVIESFPGIEQGRWHQESRAEELVLSRERALCSQQGLSTCQVCLQHSPAWDVTKGRDSSQGVASRDLCLAHLIVAPGGPQVLPRNDF